MRRLTVPRGSTQATMSDRIHVSYYSDILCVWAYVAQIRLDELQKQHGLNIDISYHFIPILGDTEHRIGEGWKERGGFEGYATHVAEVCADFPHVSLNPAAWTTVRPTSSAPSHQFLKAVQLLEAGGDISSEPVEEFDGRSHFEETAWRVRLAFFQDGRDVSRFDVLWGIAADLGLPVGALKALFDNGRALACACRDAELRTERQIEGSPTYVLNHGRQKLYGNLGYKVIEANIEEVLRRPTASSTWC